MNKIIESQVQSPLVRSLQSVPTVMESYIHHVPDNAPPTAIKKTVVHPYNSPLGKLGETYKFRIPQHGHLVRMYLKSTTNFAGSFSTNIPTDAIIASYVDNVQLGTRSNTIQTLYGDEIYARNLRQPETIRDAHKWANIGFLSGRYLPAVATSTVDPQLRYLELPFATTAAPHLNLNTRIVEPLDVTVVTNPDTDVWGLDPNIQSVTHELELVCLFRTHHDSTEHRLIEENYPERLPTSLLLYDTFAETPVIDTTTSGSTDIRIDLKCRNLAYGITIVSYRADKTYQWSLLHKLLFSTELVLGGEVYKFGHHVEHEVMDKLDFQMAYSGENRLGYSTSNSSDHASLYIQLGAQHNELINSGCVSLQNVNDPHIRIQGYNESVNSIIIKVFVHYHCMVSVDTHNGIVRRVLDQ